MEIFLAAGEGGVLLWGLNGQGRVLGGDNAGTELGGGLSGGKQRRGWAWGGSAVSGREGGLVLSIGEVGSEPALGSNYQCSEGLVASSCVVSFIPAALTSTGGPTTDKTWITIWLGSLERT